MAGFIPTDVAGGFKYTPVSYSYGANSQVISGGLSFDMPLSTVATFTNTAMQFSQDNSKNAQGFFAGIFGKAQENLTNVNNKAFEYQTTAMQTQERMYNSAIALQNNLPHPVLKILGLQRLVWVFPLTQQVCEKEHQQYHQDQPGHGLHNNAHAFMRVLFAGHGASTTNGSRARCFC